MNIALVLTTGVLSSVSRSRNNVAVIIIFEMLYSALKKQTYINLLIATLKPRSNGPSYSNTVIGTLAVDGWAVTFGTA